MALMASLPFVATAQTTVNSSGGSGTIGGNLYAYSIGEMVLVNTVSTAQFIVTQGVLQGDGFPNPGMSVDPLDSSIEEQVQVESDATTGLQEDTLAVGNMTLYPNPVDNILYLQPDLAQGGALSLRLYDLNGRLIEDREVRLNTGTERQEIDMSYLTEGSYFLRTALQQGERTSQKAFKIIKTGGVK